MSIWRYALPVEQTRWEVGSDSTTVFNWAYDDTRLEETVHRVRAVLESVSHDPADTR